MGDESIVFDNVVRAHAINESLEDLKGQVYSGMAHDGSAPADMFTQERLVSLCNRVQEVLVNSVRPAPEDLESAVQTMHQRLNAKEDELAKMRKRMQSMALKYETIIDQKNLEIEAQRSRVLALSEKVEYLSQRVQELTLLAAASQKKKKKKVKGKKREAVVGALSLDEDMIRESKQQVQSARASPRRTPQPPSGARTERPSSDHRRKLVTEKVAAKAQGPHLDPMASDEEFLELIVGMGVQDRLYWLEDMCNIYALSNSVSTELGTETAVLTLEDRAAKLMRAQGAKVFLVSEDRGEIVTFQQSGLKVTRKVFSFNDGIAGQVADSCRGVKIDRDASQHHRYSTFVDKPALCDKVESLLCRPIVDGTGRILGVIEVVRSEPNHPFGRDDDFLLRFIALQAAVSLRSGETVDSVALMQKRMHDYEKKYEDADEKLKVAEAKLTSRGVSSHSGTPVKGGTAVEGASSTSPAVVSGSGEEGEKEGSAE
uniref:GAF domain-containing protein n=1 Tax=Palpitomonas bilix TaxID=652834 RepID=A0A7S3GB04_9EUKA|mmetsp:Transcript_34639/g.89838  ORF Transcript_34639/g.89838 Transcript_34639/m.89838 type:complete len:486 (+) Transcript_34639:458-1915(+)|eukprot:CAMPEP_0113876668 /NCGR_PEP_ID=MMETSP0780_2-20120614/5618_1 /TAXON_ID=652834 /ORGANISM="Palpitomonas bilix" /LENGTH=485 /DNA_ID=CAMNT_0000862779 /DNA_START=436 /DNA_END=1893 /DNA_ORIENTATION=- /assembly_acc=CAM_ASM_000599